MQEALLAQDLMVLINDRLISIPKLAENIWDYSWADRLMLPHTLRSPKWYQGNTPGMLKAWKQSKSEENLSVSKNSILYWLKTSQDPKCDFTHDWILSLLALAEEGSKIPVDYTKPLPELAYHVLMASNHAVCVRAVILVIVSLRLWWEEIGPLNSCLYAEWTIKPLICSCMEAKQ